MESTDCELTLSLRKIPIDRFLACISIEVWYQSMNQQTYGAQGKPESHFPSPGEVLKVRLVDICKMAHGSVLS